MPKRCSDYRELDLFAAPCENNQIEKINWVEIATETTLDATKFPQTVEFVIPPASDRKMIDLSRIMLKLNLKFKVDAGVPHAAVANNILHSMIKNVIIKLNDETLATSNGLYAYASYFIDLLDTSQEQKEGLMTAQGWYPDTPKNSIIPDATNKGWETRKDRTYCKTDAQDSEFLGKLHVDLLNQERYLIPGVKIRIELTMAKPAFFIFSKHTSTAGYSTSINNAALRVPYVQLSDKSMTEIKETLKKTPVLYPIQRIVMKNLSISSTTTNVFKFEISNGQLPKKVIAAITTDDAMTGDVNKNPFCFSGKHVSYTISKIELNVDGMPYAKRAFTPDIEKGDYAISYMNFFESLNFLCDAGNAPSIPYDDFNNYCIFPFNLNPACISDPGVFKNIGTVGLEIEFESKPKETLQLIVMLIYDNCVSINHERRFTMDW